MNKNTENYDIRITACISFGETSRLHCQKELEGNWGDWYIYNAVRWGLNNQAEIEKVISSINADVEAKANSYIKNHDFAGVGNHAEIFNARIGDYNIAVVIWYCVKGFMH